jgi:hypothetical protein
MQGKWIIGGNYKLKKNEMKKIERKMKLKLMIEECK